MTESSYYSDITKYYERTATASIAWEAKFSRTDRIPFSALAEHQERFLLKSEMIFGFKVPDNGIGQKPFDGFVLYQAKSVFIAIYYQPRATEIYEIPIRIFVHQKYTSKEKSLSKKRAAELGTRIFL
jgi:hypothetical protein